ncbi:MAG TPA: DUF11 domain-containing protein, partial [Thermoplasmatales archaeon]|nr:DUF11 domain-containing protein [Thermoplasmatales archaeon]
DPLTNVYVNDTNGKSFGPFNLAVNESISFYYETNPVKDVNNTATAEGKDSDGDKVGPVNDWASVEIYQVPVFPELSIVKDDSQDPVIAGKKLTYTIHLANAGNAPAYNITVTETYDENFLYVNATPPPDAGTNNRWTFSVLREQRSIVITVNGIVLDNGESYIENVVEFTSDNGGSGRDTETTTVIPPPSPSLEIIKSDTPDPIEAGNELIYTIILSNNGDANATNVVVKDVFDEILIITEADGGTVEGNTITWNIPSLTPGENVTFTVKATVKIVDVSMVITNFVNATCIEGAYAEDTEKTTVNPPPPMGNPILEITKTDKYDPVSYRGDVEYEITVKNIGDADARNVIVIDKLPKGLNYVYADPIPDEINGSFIMWQFEKIMVGEIVSISLITNVQTFGELINRVNVTCDEGAYDEDNETTSVIEDNEPPYTKKVFHGEVHNVSIWGIYTVHYIPKSTYITLKSKDYPIPGASGVNHTYYRIWKWNVSNSKWNLVFGWKEYHGNIYLYKLASYGKYEIEFYSIDRVENVEEWKWNDVYVYETEDEIPDE